MPAPELHAGETLNITMRPKTFEEIVGLEEEVAAVRAIIDNGNIPRCFCLMGPFGCGKTSLAFLIAKYVQGFEFSDITPQIQEINAANVTGIDAMRKLIETSGNYPMIGKYGIIILDEAHKISKAAQEALLKAFEEPASPTIWIVCTTEPEKLTQGWLKGGRCFPVTVRGQDPAGIRILVERAAAARGYTGDITEFLTAVNKARVVSPRRIQMAFEAFNAGIPAARALTAVASANVFEYQDIAFAVVFGKWDKEVTLPWAGNKVIVPLGQMLRQLDDDLKKKPKPEGDVDEQDGQIEEGDVESRESVAQGVRIVVAGYLKGQIMPTLRGGKWQFKDVGKTQRACEAMHALLNSVPGDQFGLQWPGLIMTLWRVNQKLQGGA
jgi:hypothetical protein